MSETDQKLLHARELLAFHLASKSLPLQQATRDFWQALPEEQRADWRAKAEQQTAAFEKLGLSVRVCNSAVVAKSLEFLLTIPPRAAYVLPTIPQEVVVQPPTLPPVPPRN
jgi:hypothetical protein